MVILNKNKKAFTLVELLVVISIIALLLSILMPALHKVRIQARATICMSNARTLGQGALLYASGNDNFYPQGRTYISTGRANRPYRENPDGPFWDDRVFPYVGKTFDVFMCPASAASPEGREKIKWIEDRPEFGKGGHAKAYRINSIISGIRSSAIVGGGGKIWRTSEIRRPVEVILFADADVQPFSYLYSNGLRAFTDFWPRHDLKLIKGSVWKDGHDHPAVIGGAGLAFADGHTELIRWEYSEHTYGLPPNDTVRIHPTK